MKLSLPGVAAIGAAMAPSIAGAALAEQQTTLPQAQADELAAREFAEHSTTMGRLAGIVFGLTLLGGYYVFQR